MSYDNTNTGVLFKNKRKEKDTHPGYTGSINVTAPGEYWLSAWVKEKNGEKFFSLALKPKDEKAKPEVANNDPDDAIPF